MSSTFLSATVWTAPGFLEAEGLPIPSFQQLISGRQLRCPVVGEPAGQGSSCSGRLICSKLFRALQAQLHLL
jgi:hypothetical protein